MDYCTHCGDPCKSGLFELGDKKFCCMGCQTVYNLLTENNLDNYYALETQPGINPKTSSSFDYLDHPDIQKKLFLFEIDGRVAVDFSIPSMHCVSCIWLLEHLYKLCPGIEKSEVDFAHKQVKIQWKQSQLSLRQLVELLSQLGYEPHISLDQDKKQADREPLAKLVIAGICFGNIMLFSFPSYLGLALGEHLYFQILCFVFSLPLVFYCAKDYWRSFRTLIRYKQVTLDLPIFLGIIALFVQSSYEALTQTDFGYWDSLAGLIFFLLLGRTFQNMTFKQLRFDRDYKSFFPVWARVMSASETQVYPIDALTPGMKIEVKSQEVLPCDAKLLSEIAWIDYRFVSGEAEPVQVNQGDLIFAGGRNTSGLIQAKVEKSVSRSYLTSLWQEMGSRKKKLGLSNRIALVFTLCVIVIATAASMFHGYSMLIFSSVVIVACPCALALSSPLCLGFAMRQLSECGLFLKEASVVEDLAEIDHIVFDKTGTLTVSEDRIWQYEGEDLSLENRRAIKSLAMQSCHPLSRSLSASIQDVQYPVEGFQEFLGAGIAGEVHQHSYRLGSSQWLEGKSGSRQQEVCLEIDRKVKGRFLVESPYRDGVIKMIQSLAINKSLLSGDHDGEKEYLKSSFDESQLFFRQSPKDKYQKIEALSEQSKVLMLGDGLNDAGALSKSHVGMVVVEKENAFFPASDALMMAEHMLRLPNILSYSKSIVRLIKWSLGLSILYNVIGLSFAVCGYLTPIFSAILMPLSSLTIFLTAALGSSCLQRKHFSQVN